MHNTQSYEEISRLSRGRIEVLMTITSDFVKKHKHGPLESITPLSRLDITVMHTIA